VILKISVFFKVHPTPSRRRSRV